MTAEERTVVVVGTGVAGATAALTLRSEGFDGQVVLIGDEPDEPYRRPPLSKDVLRGTTPHERTRLRPSQTWQQQDIELRTSSSVSRLDTGAKVLGLADGEELGYDMLLLATGGRPRELPCTAGMTDVHTLRTLTDVPALRERLAPETSVLVIGAGLIGAEVAASARAMGCGVIMLESAPAPLPRLLPPAIAEVYSRLHRDQGVDLHTGVDVTQLERIDLGLLATDANERHWLADTVVVAIGMVPRTELAEQAGIDVDNGIVVDEYFRTSAPGVFAAGDVANQPNPVLGGRHRVEHWQSAQEQGAAAAKSMLGDRTPYERVPWCWSDQYGVNLQFTGWPAAGDDVIVRGELEQREFTAIFRRDGRLVGAVGVNRAAEIRALRKLIIEAPFLDPALLADESVNLATVHSAELSTVAT
ncbi:MAG: FAD-dependent oxidoreductase [Actinophytocola sp.]|nr:FAD-dependent oxidoreductase [Actinophytocola sp.]